MTRRRPAILGAPASLAGLAYDASVTGTTGTGSKVYPAMGIPPTIPDNRAVHLVRSTAAYARCYP